MVSGNPSDGSEGKCPLCENPYMVLIKGESLAVNGARYSTLYRCPECGRLYESLDLSKQNPRQLTLEEARELFPDAELA